MVVYDDAWWVNLSAMKQGSVVGSPTGRSFFSPRTSLKDQTMAEILPPVPFRSQKGS